ncbi:translation initiation factor IF-2-like [Bactrocera neohumeralis]|uniref:translation initiation factor IF-2-like n=1 Tax=Bactrocera tryoni TaxID=59916 RepID=UPI001A990D5F|nr:translation initiation factor IF-2-like [Bactrocera tryoni]XP_050333514.1 translation initiation factor IF-2-like [Bactrocera neohumeralis]
MARFLQILLVASLAFALCAAEAPRFRGRNGRLQLSKQRSRFLARQEAAEEAAVTPYPSAKELIPEIPFDEAAAAAAPEVPVEAPAVPEGDVNVSVNVELPAEQAPVEEEADEPALADEAEGEHEPDLIYGPPEAEDVPVVNEVTPVEEIEATIAEEEDEQAAEEEAIESARLTFGRRINARKSARPAKLRAAVRARPTSAKSARIVRAKVTTKARSARLQQLPQQPQFFVPQQFAAQQRQQPVFYYTAGQLQQW